MHLHRTLLIVALLSLISWSLTTAAPPHLRKTPEVRAVEKVRAAVVNIHSERTARGPATEELFATRPLQNRSNGMGTGIVLDPRGYIVTNHHVVEDVSALRVRLNDGSTYTARVVARDRENDLALMKIDAGKSLPVMPLATSSDLMVGERVIAIGNAYGYEHTVTAGVVSALNRDVTLNKDIAYKSLIQTDASINPGNSGGPLLNIEGELIGVNVAIRAGAQGIGFAIPVDQMVQTVTDMMARTRKNSFTHGLICRNRIKVEATPPRYLEIDRADAIATKAGFRGGDVMLQIGDVTVHSSIDFERALYEAKPGDTLPVKVRRGETEYTFDLQLQGAPQGPSAMDLAWRQLGLRLATASGELVTRSNATLRGGMMITEVNPDGPAARAGIQRGDILAGLHQWETINMDNVAYVLNHQDLNSFYPLKFYLLRSGSIHRGWLQTPE